MIIPFRQEWYEQALEEQRQREPYMLTKFKNTPARKEGQKRGLVIQHHVSGWFKENYPDHYLEADNFRQWDKICSHDFKLKVKAGVICIDVSGPDKDGNFGCYYEKPTAGVDFHILCKPLGFKAWNDCDFTRGFEISGVLKSQDYLTRIDPQQIIGFQTWLNNIGL
ncbi:MAG: hypothetical protein NZM13_08430 [Cyclobacteriaceae bacterium]|nr:hypothetical protein [Cyclobacteriaceae bacterium]MDW8330655.1 hypothetical protein [Cyclobacteriaceae bacterium]